MKRLLISSALVFVTMLHTSFRPPEGAITFVITGLKSNKGSVLLSLFNSEKDFPRRVAGSVGKGRSVIQNNSATITIRNLPYGRYAAAMLHDENNNQEMDYNMIGMPKEGFGFSNNAKAALAPPPFNKAAVHLNAEEMKTTIKVVY